MLNEYKIMENVRKILNFILIEILVHIVLHFFFVFSQSAKWLNTNAVQLGITLWKQIWSHILFISNKENYKAWKRLSYA